MRRVLVTGGTGFVGRHLVPFLAARGWRVRVALRAPVDGTPSAANVEFIAVGDLAGAIDWRPALAGVEAVVHAAGIAHAGPGLPDDLYERVNHRATLSLAQAAARAGVGRFVFLSSIRAQSGPTAEGILTEETPPAPTDAYGRAKLAAEQGLGALDGFSWTALRPVVVYGPGVRGNMGALLRLAALPMPLPLGGLTAARSVVSVENLCDAVAFVLDRPDPSSGPLVVADPAPSSVAAMVSALRTGLGRAPGLVPVPAGLLGAALRVLGRGEAWDRLAGPLAADPARLIGLGWRPPVPNSEQGLSHWAESTRRG